MPRHLRNSATPLFYRQQRKTRNSHTTHWVTRVGLTQTSRGPTPLDMCFSTALYSVRSYKTTKANSCHFTDSFYTRTREHVRRGTCSLDFIQGTQCSLWNLNTSPSVSQTLQAEAAWNIKAVAISMACGHHLPRVLEVTASATPCGTSSWASGDGSWSPDHMGYQTTRLEYFNWEDINSSVLNQTTLQKNTWEMLLELLCQCTLWGILEHQGRGNSFTQHSYFCSK